MTRGSYSYGQKYGHSSTGKRRALLIGCNYTGSQAALRGCINDTETLSDLLVSTYGWSRRNMWIMTDNTQQRPTKQNIIEACKWLVSDAKPGDVFFFSFSGHGAQQEDPNGYEEDGMNETILPLDFKSAGMITDDTLNAILVRPLPSGAKLLAVLDACHSGTGLDLPHVWTGSRWKEDVNPMHTRGDVQMFSGCEDDDVSADAQEAGRSGGAMTVALATVLRQYPHPTYPDLLRMLHSVLRNKGHRQRPVLTSSQMFDFDHPFDLEIIVPNRNAQVGRIFRRKFKPNPSAKAQKFLRDIGGGGGMAQLGILAMICQFLMMFANPD